MDQLLTCAKCGQSIPANVYGCPDCERRKKEARKAPRMYTGTVQIIAGTILIVAAIIAIVFVGAHLTKDLQHTGESTADAIVDNIRFLYWSASVAAGFLMSIPGIILICSGSILSTLKEMRNSMD